MTTATESTLMWREIGESAAAVARFVETNADAIAALVERLRAAPPPVIVTCARGSSDHAATYGKYLFETLLGIPVASAAPSVSSVFDRRVAPDTRGGATLVVAISQSGRSPDLLASVDAYQRAGARVVALTNDADSDLAQRADTLLPLCAGPERSVAATKSYIASLAGLASIAAAWAGDRALGEAIAALPAMLADPVRRDPAMIETLTGARNLFVIGRGYGLAVAQEAALKLKETCALHAEAFSAAEVRHGPMAIVGPGFPILGFVTPDAAGEDVRAVATEFAQRGAKVQLFDIDADVHPAIAPIVMIRHFYAVAATVSIARGLDPDSPPHLRKVTRTR